MVEYSEEVKRLAETLKNSGLSASMSLALEKAQEMIGKKEPKEKVQKEESVKIDVQQTTLSDVPDASEPENAVDNAEEEDSDEIRIEEVFKNAEDNSRESQDSSNDLSISEQSSFEQSSRKVQPKEKKIDLTNVFNVNK